MVHVGGGDGFAESVREFLRERADGVSVVAVADAAAALAELEEGDVDCVVSGHRSAGTDGLDLLRRVRDRWPDLPFILVSGADEDDAVALEAIGLGATDYLRETSDATQYALLANRIRNLVAHERAEAAVELTARRTEAQFKLLVDSVEDYAIFLLDEEGYIRTWNRGAENIKGYEREEVVGEHFSVFYREEDVEAGVPERNLRDAAEHDQVQDEGWRVRADGSEFWADVTITALRHDGELVGYAKVTRDNTAAHQERMLLEQNEQLRHLITSISHDLKNPLNVAEGNVELAADTGDLSYLDESRRALDRVNELLSYLTNLAKEGGRLTDPVPVDLREVVEASWVTAGGDRERLSVDASLDHAVVTADRHQLRQLFENLFANAHCHGGPDVRVRVGRLEGGDTGVFVADDGPGIPEGEHEAVFEIGHTHQPDGTGFGLAICEQIAETHGWCIGATDARDGGARFELRGMTFEDGRATTTGERA
ncbi:PAS domain-containing protein [Candidatus Halobonum tyrrellensis G22]|uniref:histidine kinase n=1 Tax=Candidatus Halobonum tyrrellensis G22 TaxID=1324957 RepID=V4HFR0_9EURY|nr:PAS domain-containing protein [Candidatus Halobonum tyrrellensis G22]